MQGYNLILVYNEYCDKLLMCIRNRNPYMGLRNLVGGKIEKNEIRLDAAYRELMEETGIQKSDIELKHMMDFTYHMQNCYVEIYVGRLKKPVNVHGDENELFWTDLNHNFFDTHQYAGEGNIGHMIEHANRIKETL